MSASAPSDRVRLRQRPRVGLVLEGTVAVELEFGQQRGGRACRRAAARGRRGRDRSSWRLPPGGWPRPSRPSWATKSGGGAGLHRRASARAAAAQRRTAWGGYFASRCKAGLLGDHVRPVACGGAERRKIAARSRCRPAPPPLRSPLSEGRGRGSPGPAASPDGGSRDRRPQSRHVRLPPLPAGPRTAPRPPGRAAPAAAAASAAMPSRRRSSLRVAQGRH